MLLPQHQALLEGSGISEEVAGKRPYFSATTGAALRQLGFGRSQLSVPALLIPLYDVHGEPFGYQARPDQPRQVRGKTVKYETPSKQANRLDVPPLTAELLDDPSVPVILTEGSRKADSAASRGMCAVSLNGVYGWRGTNTKGGKTVLPDFGAIALNDRQVILCFDSDAMTKPEVHQALAGLAAFLQMRHAVVLFAYLPPLASGAKCGLDDWLVADPARGFAALDALCRSRLDPLESEQREDRYDDVEPESGATLLSDVSRFLRRFVVFPDEHSLNATTVWVPQTHAIDSFDVTARLHVRSPDKQSGKTRLMEMLALLCRRAELSANMSPSYLFRSVEATCPTLLVDEVDAIFGWKASQKGGNHEDLRALLNAGYSRGATVGRVEGDGANLVPRQFKIFCPVALAGIGDIPDTLNDRSIPIRMRRRRRGESVERLRRRLVVAEAAGLRRRLEAWAKRNRETLTELVPVMPDNVEDRAADVWEPLVAIADLAGGPWSERVRTACVELNRQKEQADESLARWLLSDTRDLFDNEKVDRLSSKTLCERLRDIEESPWDGWHKGRGFQPSDLARMLRGFDIRPSVIRMSATETPRGYLRADFEDAWERYLSVDNKEAPPPSGNPQQAQQRNSESGEGSEFGTPGCNIDEGATENAPSDVQCCGVADVAPSPGGEDQLADAHGGNVAGEGAVAPDCSNAGSADALMGQLRKRRRRT
jgi:hypothetical protein